MFKNCTLINKIEAAFMGTDIEDIEDTGGTNPGFLGDVITSDSPSATNITSIAALFANSSITNCNGLTKFVNKFAPYITKADYAFSGSAINNADIISTFSKLQSAVGVFSECESLESLPRNLFASSKNTIKDISYAFARSGINELSEVTQTDVTLQEPKIVIYNNDETDESNNIIAELIVETVGDKTESKYYLMFRGSKITSIKLDTDKKLEITTASDVYRIEFTSIKLQFDVLESLPEKQYFSLYGGYYNNLDEIVFLRNIDGTQVDESLSQTIELCTKTTFTNTVFCRYTNLKPSIDEGLLYECSQLTSTEGAFYNTSLKHIPSQIFKTSLNSSYPLLTNISYMFASCSECLASQDYNLIPGDWLTSCGKITTIEGLFFNLGKDVPEVDSVSANGIGTAFNHLS